MHAQMSQSVCDILTKSVQSRDSRGRDRMVVGFTTIYAISAFATKVVNSNPANGDMYSIQHYVIKLVNDLRQVGGFLPAFRFPPPIKLTTML